MVFDNFVVTKLKYELINCVMKKTLLFSLFGILLLTPAKVSAQDNPPEFPDGLPHLAPAWRLYSVNYYEDTGDLMIFFRRVIPEATLFMYKDGFLVYEDYMTSIQAGDTVTTNLPLFGTGLFTIYIQIGERMYAVFEEEIEE